jgi:hypothetical protein
MDACRRKVCPPQLSRKNAVKRACCDLRDSSIALASLSPFSQLLGNGSVAPALHLDFYGLSAKKMSSSLRDYSSKESVDICVRVSTAT